MVSTSGSRGHGESMSPGRRHLLLLAAVGTPTCSCSRSRVRMGVTPTCADANTAGLEIVVDEAPRPPLRRPRRRASQECVPGYDDIVAEDCDDENMFVGDAFQARRQ